MQQTWGYILQEVMVGLIIFAIAMAPILRALVLVPRVAAAADAEIRAENWRSACDQVAAVGIDPAQSPVLQSVGSESDLQVLAPHVERSNLSAQNGAPRISLLSETFNDTAEDRSLAAGIEISANTSIEIPRTDPLAPLPIVKIPQPSLSPATGTFINVMALVSATEGDPFVTKIQARSAATGEYVHLSESSPTRHALQATDEVSLTVNAVELAQAVTGSTWSEYPGNQKTDTRVDLQDGRTRWLVKIGTQTQVYEPSDPVAFIYGIDIGRPVYKIAGKDYDSGDSLDVNFSEARLIETGARFASISYSSEVQSRFGEAWETIAPRFTWSFGSLRGDSSSGNTASVYTAKGRLAWNDDQILTATPTPTLTGLKSSPGSWTISRAKIALAAPERVSSFYYAVMDEAGPIDFAAPSSTFDGKRYGRPEVDGIESVGTTLSITLIP